jgi:hypothetical protein
MRDRKRTRQLVNSPGRAVQSLSYMLYQQVATRSFLPSHPRQLVATLAPVTHGVALTVGGSLYVLQPEDVTDLLTLLRSVALPHAVEAELAATSAAMQLEHALNPTSAGPEMSDAEGRALLMVLHRASGQRGLSTTLTRLHHVLEGHYNS